MVYEKVENHWSGQDALIDTLELRFIGEPSTVLAGLLSGEADIAVLPRELQPDAIDAGFEVISSANASNQTSFLFNGTFFLEGDEALNPDLPWLDIRIREAVNRAVDRETLIDIVYDGRAEILPVFGMDPRHEGYREDLAERFAAEYGYDPERAKALLAEAGYPENFAEPVIPILITQLPGSTEFPTMAEVMQVFLEEAGFQTRMIELDWAGLGALRRARDPRARSGEEPWPTRSCLSGWRSTRRRSRWRRCSSSRVRRVATTARFRSRRMLCADYARSGRRTMPRATFATRRGHRHDQTGRLRRAASADPLGASLCLWGRGDPTAPRGMSWRRP